MLLSLMGCEAQLELAHEQLDRNPINLPEAGDSWSPYVSCRPLLASISDVIGHEPNRLGGSSLQGSPFRPGIPDKNALSPPCEVDGKPMFVEVHAAELIWTRHQGDGDLTFHLIDPDRPELPDKMRSIHSEISGEWIDAKQAASLDLPPPNTRIDVQGFVYWDYWHVSDAWHNDSGWEIHPVTAWRASEMHALTVERSSGSLDP
jgi:hypothetical protein